MTTADIISTIILVRLIRVCVLACRSIFLCLFDFIKLPLAATKIQQPFLLRKIFTRLNYSLT